MGYESYRIFREMVMTQDNYKVWGDEGTYKGWLYDSTRNKYYFNDIELRLEEMFMIQYINSQVGVKNER